MEDTIKIELLTPLTGTFLPNEMEQDWEEEDYNDFEEEQVFFEGDDLTEYASVIQGTIAAAAVINEIIAVYMAKKGLQNTTVSDMTMIGPII